MQGSDTGLMVIMSALLRLRRLTLTALVSAGILLVGLWYYMVFQLPDIDALNTVQLQVPLQILTRDHKLIAEYGEKRRIPVTSEHIPKQLISAILATEDQRYFQHSGVDITGLARAAVLLVATGKKSQGGSTITMQVARSFYLNRHKTYGRKLREILLALKINHKLSKQKILELYLNKIFLGNRAYGVAAAAEVYYGKTLDQLSLDEIAMLAGLPQAPSALNPISHPDAALKRRNHVLTRMHDLGLITDAEYSEAQKAPVHVHYHELQTEVKAPWFAERVRRQLEEMYGDIIYTDGFVVETTLDSTLQAAANQSVREALLAYDQRHGYRGPERNLGTPSLKNMPAFEKILAETPTVNNLQPAVVTDLTDETVTVLLASGKFATIPWQGLSWARRQINPDFLGPRPESAEQIVKPGDLVRIQRTVDSLRLAQLPRAEAGLVSLDPADGAIRAMVGGFDFQRSKFNRITDAERQPGSSFKPFIYSAAFEKGYTLASLVNDAPVIYQNPSNDSFWRPQNDERHFYGPTSLRDALIHSRNLVTIRLLSAIRVPWTINYLQKFGFDPKVMPHELTLALGTASVTPLQMAAAYAVFANGGYRVEPWMFSEIQNSQGKMLYQSHPLRVCRDCPPDSSDNTRAERVITAQNAFLLTSVLHDVIEHGTGIRAKRLKRHDLAGKTGTTQNQVDAWFAGYSPTLVALAWMGFDQPRSLHEFGGEAALPLWIAYMQKALKDVPDHPLPEPPGIVSIRIDPLTGRRASAGSPVARLEYFMENALPAQAAPETGDASTGGGEGGLY